MADMYLRGRQEKKGKHYRFKCKFLPRIDKSHDNLLKESFLASTGLLGIAVSITHSNGPSTLAASGCVDQRCLFLR